MKPEEIRFYIYANGTNEVQELEKALYDFVLDQYNQGTIVTARMLTDIIKKAAANPVLLQLLK